MGYLIGVLLALAVSTFATVVRLDRDRAFYPTVVIVVASYYVLFALIGGSPRTTLAETIVMTGFLLVAVWGFRFNLWWAVAALAGHGIFDFFHEELVKNQGVPVWWPAFCLAYDVTAAAFLAWQLVGRQHAARQPDSPPLAM